MKSWLQYLTMEGAVAALVEVLIDKGVISEEDLRTLIEQRTREHLDRQLAARGL